MAGVYARIDNERGVHKAPANEIVRGALGLALHHLQGASRTSSTRSGINCIRNMRRPRHPHLGRPHAVERSVVALHQRPPPLHHGGDSRSSGTQWVVFEPNDRSLWKRVSRNITALPDPRMAQRRAHGRDAGGGVLRQVRRGDQPARGRSTSARWSCEIGLAPVKPAEFVIFRIGQMPAPRNKNYPNSGIIDPLGRRFTGVGLFSAPQPRACAAGWRRGRGPLRRRARRPRR